MAREAKQVVGVGRSTGEYQGHSYDNVILHCLYQSDKITGSGVTAVKVKARVFDENPVKVNEKIDFNYDRYGNVNEIVKL